MLHDRFRARSAVALLAAAGALLVPAAAQAATQTASAGGVTAIFTYHGSGFSYHGETITIKRHGTVVYRHAVAAGPACGTGCVPGAQIGKSVQVLDLEHNGSHEVVLDLFTGGAHCCWIAQVYYPSAKTYGRVQRNFGDPGWSIGDLGHNRRLEFLTANDDFAYRFTSFAASGLPIQILAFRHGAFHDVTRAYPKLIAKDAKVWLDAFKHHHSDGEGVIAAWAADEYMLGHRTQANQYLNQQARVGHLNTDTPGGPTGHKFVVALQKFLKAEHY